MRPAEDATGFQASARRGVAEPTFARPVRHRRLARDHERDPAGAEPWSRPR
ncbi:hypothetical protein GCM10023224_17130 [Streptomonospora halophila]|uniref:Uncharacterized protein n=1 Tax=Streptomonospora halophila TaxID=427369 RepID=A0ABP9GK79_9ACTN